MAFPESRIRRACVEARNAPGMRAGLPRVTLDVSQVEALLDRLAGAEQECNRLAAETAATERVRDHLASQAAAMSATLGRIRTATELPEVTEESSDCPSCGASCEWRGDGRGPDIGDVSACDSCIAERFYAIQRLLADRGSRGMPPAARMAPEWDGGLPYCSDRCPSHDGKRCDLLGHRPPELCAPAVRALSEGAAEYECNRLTREALADVAAERQRCADFLRRNIRTVRSAGIVVHNADVQERLEQLATRMSEGRFNDCPDCYGYGRYDDGDDQWRRTTRCHLSAWPEGRLWAMCRACGGTPMGSMAWAVRER